MSDLQCPLIFRVSSSPPAPTRPATPWNSPRVKKSIYGKQHWKEAFQQTSFRNFHRKYTNAKVQRSQDSSEWTDGMNGWNKNNVGLCECTNDWVIKKWVMYMYVYWRLKWSIWTIHELPIPPFESRIFKLPPKRDQRCHLRRRASRPKMNKFHSYFYF